MNLRCFAILLFCASVLRAEIPGLDLETAIARVKPALVQIYVVAASYSGGREVKNQASGSGVIISEDGYVLSNHHVAGHSVRLVCVMSDNEEIDAELVGTDPLSDISVIRLKPATPRKFPKAEFGDSDALRVGDPVLAMGSPMALSQSVTLGIVSNTKMVLPRLLFPFNQFQLDGEDVGSIVRWIAHDAAIFGGNSGGPLVNLKGEIVGVNEISMGLSGAIPGNLTRAIAEALMRDGKVHRSWIGLDVQPLLKSSETEKGILVSGTVSDSPAEHAGFQSGDILLKLAGREVGARFNEELPAFNLFVANLPIGQEVDAEISRSGTNLTLQVATMERAEMRPQQEELPALGVTVRDITPIMAKELKLDSSTGVIVTGVRPGGAGGESKPALAVKDVIVTLAGEPIVNMAGLRAVAEKITKGQSEPVPAIMRFNRRKAELLTTVKVGIKELEDPGLEVKKAWLPAATQVITRDLADQLKLGDLGGVRVTQVYSGSTAEKAGLRVGDLITEVDGAPLRVFQQEDFEVLPALIRQYQVGARPSFTLLREGERMTLAIELERAPKLEREMKSYRDERFEFTARETTYFDRMREEWGDDERGLFISDVTPGGWAALGPLAVSDLLLAVDGQPMPDVDALRGMMKQLAERKPKTVVFTVLRGIHHIFVELEPDWTRE